MSTHIVGQKQKQFYVNAVGQYGQRFQEGIIPARNEQEALEQAEKDFRRLNPDESYFEINIQER